MAPISLDKVTKVYPNGFRAVDELDLDVREGEFMVLLGPSGSGKTTALRMVAGLEEVTDGLVYIGDRVVNDVEPKDRDIAMVFQNYALYANMTVRENIGFALKLRRMPKAEVASRVAEAAELLGLTEFIDRKPSQLSGGQRQRVAMGRAIVREPSVFLMDEPLSNLDAKLRVQMRAEVLRIQRRLGVATLYVTHDQVEAMTMGDRVAVLSGGLLQQCDDPQLVYENPRNLFVAGFMGSPPMNLFEATVAEGARSIRVGSQALALPAKLLAETPELAAYAGRQVVLGVHPEDLTIVNSAGDGDDGERCVLEGTVELVEALGSEQLVHFTTDARAVEVEGTDVGDAEGLSKGKIGRAGEGVARIDARTSVTHGTRVPFVIDPRRLRLFDPTTTEAIGLDRSGNGGSGGRSPRARGAAARASHDTSGETDDGHSLAGVAADVRGLSAELPGGDSAHPLSGATLPRLSARLPVPSYARGTVTPGIVHFGVGGFHRAHQAMYVDRLLNAGGSREWGIYGVGVLASDRAMQQALEPQDHLYTLVEKHSDGRYDARVIGSIVDYLYARDDPEAVIDRLADPATRIVSLTITEGGYGIDDVTGKFNPQAPGIADDLRPNAAPRSVFGLLVAALRRRRGAGLEPFTIVSCDNLQGNGSLTHEALIAFTSLLDASLADWIEREVRFPNSMVDRITPATTESDREEVSSRFGINDRWPVVCEPFTQWVLEDSFSTARPPLEEAGVQIVSSVAPYELMKLRLLNGSHQALCYFARLCGYTYVHEAAQDPLFAEFLRGYMDDEATPTLDPVPGVDLDEYKQTLIERFSNPEIRDTIARLCAESSDRIPKWLLPVIRFQLEHDGPIARAAAVVASWARYAEGTDEHGEPIEIVDRRRDQIMVLAARQPTEPTAFIENRELFGDLASNERFVSAYLSVLRSLHERGARRTLEELVKEPSSTA
jgi:mannitol 2-dehydrogenase